MPPNPEFKDQCIFRGRSSLITLSLEACLLGGCDNEFWSSEDTWKGDSLHGWYCAREGSAIVVANKCSTVRIIPCRASRANIHERIIRMIHRARSLGYEPSLIVIGQRQKKQLFEFVEARSLRHSEDLRKNFGKWTLSGLRVMEATQESRLELMQENKDETSGLVTSVTRVDGL